MERDDPIDPEFITREDIEDAVREAGDTEENVEVALEDVLNDFNREEGTLSDLNSRRKPQDVIESGRRLHRSRIERLQRESNLGEGRLDAGLLFEAQTEEQIEGDEGSANSMGMFEKEGSKRHFGSMPKQSDS